MSQPRICPYCSSQVPPGSSYCPVCGAPQPGVAPQTPPPTPTQVPPTTPPPPAAPPPSVQQPPTAMPSYPTDVPMTEPKAEIGIGSVLGDTISLYLGHIFQFFFPFLILVGLAEVINFATYVIAGNLSGVFVPIAIELFGSIISIILEAIAAGMVIKIAFDLYQGREADVGASIRLAQTKIGKIVIASIIYGILVAIGLFLLVIPGVYLMTMWAVYIQVIVLEGAGATESLSRSSKYTKKNRFEIFVVMFVLIVLTLVVGFAIYWIIPNFGLYGNMAVDIIVNALLAPLTPVAATIIYVQIKQLKATQNYAEA